jgi:hypothetical protein
MRLLVPYGEGNAARLPSNLREVLFEGNDFLKVRETISEIPGTCY